VKAMRAVVAIADEIARSGLKKHEVVISFLALLSVIKQPRPNTATRSSTSIRMTKRRSPKVWNIAADSCMKHGARRKIRAAKSPARDRPAICRRFACRRQIFGEVSPS